MRVQHDLRISDVRILRLNRSALCNVVRHQCRRDRNVDRIPGLSKPRFIVSVDKIPHDEVSDQRRQGIRRHQFHDRVR